MLYNQKNYALIVCVHFRKRVHPEIEDSAAAAPAKLHILARMADALRASGAKNSLFAGGSGGDGLQCNR